MSRGYTEYSHLLVDTTGEISRHEKRMRQMNLYHKRRRGRSKSYRSLAKVGVLLKLVDQLSILLIPSSFVQTKLLVMGLSEASGLALVIIGSALGLVLIACVYGCIKNNCCSPNGGGVKPRKRKGQPGNEPPEGNEPPIGGPVELP